MMDISLTSDDFDLLLMMTGYATGAAFKEGDKPMAYRFLRLANTINKDNPHWTPYAVPEEEA